MDKQNKIIKHSKATIKAMNLIGKSVVAVNEDAILEYGENLKECFYMGVKDNGGIPREILKKLNGEGFIFHTLDSKSVGGRAIDVNLTNPLTGRIMTGSSSATAINVLMGINDLGVGTDGGGSVLAPSIAVHMYSFLGKGMGLKVGYEKKSTDGISFEAGIGFIGSELETVKKATFVFEKEREEKQKLNVCLLLHDGEQYSELMRRKIEFLKDILSQKDNIELKIKQIDLFSSREQLIDEINMIKNENTVFISYENNIDLYGVGDSVLGLFGESGRLLQNEGNKGIIRILNMVNANALTIPDEELCSAFVIYGFNNELVNEIFNIGKIIDNNTKKNKVFEGYFKSNYGMKNNSLIFDL